MSDVRQPDNNWFSTALLGCMDGFFDWNPSSGAISLSSSFKNILGYARQDLMGDNKDFFPQHLHTADQERVLKEFSTFFTSAHMEFYSEMRLKLKNTEYRWFKIQGKAFRDETGKCTRFAGIVVNIHEYKSHLNDSVEDSNTKSKFIAMLNHELRSPLASIISTAKLLTEEPLSDKQNRYTQNIIQSADLLLMLVNDILDISKIAAGKLEIEQRSFDFRETVDMTVEMCQPSISQKGLTLDVQIDPAIPQVLIGDSMRIKQVMLNLMTNSVKFTQKGGLKIKTAFIKMAEARGKLRVEVSDTGIGIPQDRISKLFQDFIQADISTARQYGGTGLGLSICKKIIDLMGGEIGVNSKEKEGSTFFFEIPLGIEKVDTSHKTISTNTSEHAINEPRMAWKEDASKVAPQSSPQNASNASVLRVLVAEDNMVNQEVMRGLLEALGHQIVIAENGQVAFEQCTKESFDLILMDLNMPILDGVQATIKIRAINKDIPILAVTANSMESERQRCLEAGMNDFITKPVDKLKLMQLFAPFIDAKKGNKATASQPKEGAMTEGTLAGGTYYIEKERLKQLMVDVGGPKVKQFLDLYKQEAPILIENLKNNVELEHAAHTLAGMSENLSFIALGKRSRDILQLVREKGREAPIAPLISDLPTLYQETVRRAEEMVG